MAALQMLLLSLQIACTGSSAGRRPVNLLLQVCSGVFNAAGLFKLQSKQQGIT
jgi:hypothetical protein